MGAGALAVIRPAGEAVRAGALADLAVLVPVVIVYVALHGTGAVTGDGPTIAVGVAGALVAPFVGGYVAGRRPGNAPYTNGAAATGTATLAYVAFRIVDALVRDQSLAVSPVVFLLIVAMTLGAVGAGIGFRTRPRPPLADSGP